MKTPRISPRTPTTGTLSLRVRTLGVGPGHPRLAVRLVRGERTLLTNALGADLSPAELADVAAALRVEIHDDEPVTVAGATKALSTGAATLFDEGESIP